jgi:uncharacterized protein (TIGR03435 family)
VGTGENNYQIEAAADNPSTASADELTQMFRTMLADRFNLKLHWETKQRQGYALVVAKSGPRLKEAAPDEKLSPANFIDNRGNRIIKGRSTLSELTLFLSGQLVEFSTGAAAYPPLVDKTGLPAIYEYELTLPLPRGGGQRGDDAQVGGLPQPTDRARTISAALENQLGLKLEAERIPFEVPVIDQADRPTPN